LKSFIPGRLILCRGTWRDYLSLERFHYRARRPATVAGVWVVRHISPRGKTGRTVAAAVLSYPTISCVARDQALGLHVLPSRQRIRFVNAHIRTISRVIVHPTFRSLGLANHLVGEILRECPTRYVEALAMMGRVHPFFSAAGMNELRPIDEGKPSYFWFDRDAKPTPVRLC
jgi:ABC-type ATPase with predicted acetyltransferase domain